MKIYPILRIIILVIWLTMKKRSVKNSELEKGNRAKVMGLLVVMGIIAMGFGHSMAMKPLLTTKGMETQEMVPPTYADDIPNDREAKDPVIPMTSSPKSSCASEYSGCSGTSSGARHV